MKFMNVEVVKLMERLKEAQGQLKAVLEEKDWVDEAKRYAERQGKEVKKLVKADVAEVKTFLESERKQLDSIQKQIPGEIKRVEKFLNGQKKELKKLIENVRRVHAGASAPKQKGKPSRKKTAKTK